MNTADEKQFNFFYFDIQFSHHFATERLDDLSEVNLSTFDIFLILHLKLYYVAGLQRPAKKKPVCCCQLKSHFCYVDFHPVLCWKSFLLYCVRCKWDFSGACAFQTVIDYTVFCCCFSLFVSFQDNESGSIWIKWENYLLGKEHRQMPKNNTWRRHWYVERKVKRISIKRKCGRFQFDAYEMLLLSAPTILFYL